MYNIYNRNNLFQGYDHAKKNISLFDKKYIEFIRINHIQKNMYKWFL